MITVLIGYGKVAKALIGAFDIDFCLVRDLSKVESWHSDSGVHFTTSYEDVKYAALYIIAVNDDSVSQIAEQLSEVVGQDSVVVHTSGSVSIDVLSRYFTNSGVLYPLYPFADAVNVDFGEVVTLLEGSSDCSLGVMREFLLPMGGRVEIVDSQLRAQVHIAAVFACNFVNHMVSLSQSYLSDSGLELEILKPLLCRCFDNILNSKDNISSLQTGPAVREDHTVIDRHLQMLQGREDIYNIYKSVTESIIDRKYGKF